MCQAVCPVLLGVFSAYGLVCQGRSALHLDFVWWDLYNYAVFAENACIKWL
jgi:hypothetical protein